MHHTFRLYLQKKSVIRILDDDDNASYYNIISVYNKPVRIYTTS